MLHVICKYTTKMYYCGIMFTSLSLSSLSLSLSLSLFHTHYKNHYNYFIIIILNNVKFAFVSTQESTLQDAEEMVYTSRQLNSLSTSVLCFNLVVFCNTSQIYEVKNIVSKCFDSAEIAYCYKENLLNTKGKK